MKQVTYTYDLKEVVNIFGKYGGFEAVNVKAYLNGVEFRSQGGVSIQKSYAPFRPGMLEPYTVDDAYTVIDGNLVKVAAGWAVTSKVHKGRNALMVEVQEVAPESKRRRIWKRPYSGKPSGVPFHGTGTLHYTGEWYSEE